MFRCAQANILLAIVTSMLLHGESLQPSDQGTISAAEPFGRQPYGWMLVVTTAMATAACIAECANRIARMWRANARISTGFDNREVALRLRVGGAFVPLEDDGVAPWQPELSAGGGETYAGFTVDSG